MSLIKKYSIIGFFFTLVFGTLNHFVYEWTKKATFVGLFCPVNESPWEHLKLLFFPVLFFTAIELIVYGKEESGLIPSRFLGAMLGCFFIIGFFYLYTYFLKTNFLAVDIGTFVVATALCYLIGFLGGNFKGFKSQSSIFSSVIGFIIVSFIFFIRTFA